MRKQFLGRTAIKQQLPRPRLTRIQRQRARTGGSNENGTLDSALIYDPSGNPQKLVPTSGNMAAARADHTSTPVARWQGLVDRGDLVSGTLLKSAEIYDPAAGFFTSVAISRSSHTATLLPDGRVLIVGGKSAELFDPATHTFTATANVPVKRKSHAAILLNDGTVVSEGVMSVDWLVPRGDLQPGQ